MLQKEYPILEYDSEQQAVLMPNRKNLYNFPVKCVYGFLGDTINTYAQKNNLPIIGQFRSMMKVHPVYKITANEQEVVLYSAPLGASAAVAVLDWLIGHGVKEIIAIGGCGVLMDIPENEMLIPVSAIRDEGTSYHYQPASREIPLDAEAITAITVSLDSLNIRYKKVKTWTTDAIYRETKDKVKLRKSEGCHTVEMECSAMASCAKFRGATFGQILFTQDSLANVYLYDERNFGMDSFDKAIDIALHAVLYL